METCQSGRMGRTRNAVDLHGSRRFESSRLRIDNFLSDATRVPQKRSDRLDRKNVDNQENNSGLQKPLLFSVFLYNNKMYNDLMADFFDKNFFQSIVSGIVILVISTLLGIKTRQPDTAGKGWKIVVIIGYIMIFFGLYVFAINVNKGGLNNPYTGLGISLFVFGIIVRLVGKFFDWFRH